MNLVLATERLTVPAKKPSAPKPDPPFVRVEFQAPPDFLPLLNRARKKRGLSKSAYLRQAAMLLIEADLKLPPQAGAEE